VSGGCTLAEDRVRPLGHVLDLDARHGAIMALEAPEYKPDDGGRYCEPKSSWHAPGHLSERVRKVPAAPPAMCLSCSPAKIEVSGRLSGKRSS
jgi:hypothetical protein